MTTVSAPNRLRMLRHLRLLGLFVWGLGGGVECLPAQDVNAIAADEPGLLTIEGTVVDENGAAAPKTRVRLYTYSLKGAVPTSLADAEGRFRFSVDLATARYLLFVADSLKDGKKAYMSIQEEGTLGLPTPLKLVLKPPRVLSVEVRDQQGKPVADAHVEASALMTSIANGLTESDGTVRFTVPADARVDSVFALKSGHGFDYWSDRMQPAAPAHDLPEKLDLTLNGARRVRVRAIDNEGLPVARITVRPWTITKQGRAHYANLSGGFMSRHVTSETDARGIATLDWIPVDFANRVTFLTGSREFHLPETPFVTNDMQDDVELTMKLLRTTEISGTVLAEDGTPAPGIVVQAEGRGNTHYFRNLARTNAAGRFKFDAYPEQAYLVAVLDENWGASSKVIERIAEGQPVNDIELRLNRGTVVRGVVTGADGGIRANVTVTLVQKAQAAGPVPLIAELVRWANTDSEGRYHFRVGSGTFELMDPEHAQNILLKVESQPEVIRDFRAK